MKGVQVVDCIAIYAAVIATLGLIWNIIQWYKQRGKLKVSAAICKDKGSYTEEVELKQWGDVLRVDVVNSGKANITLTEIGFKTARSKPLYFWKALPQGRIPPSGNQIQLPHTLEPTKPVYWLLGNIDLLLNLRTMKKFFVKDSHGKEWYISKSQMKKIRKIIKFSKEQLERNDE